MFFMDNPAVEIWASLAKFKLKSLNLYFWLDWIPWIIIKSFTFSFIFVTKIVQSQFWIFGKKLFLSQKLRLLDLPRSEFNLLLFSFCSLPKLSRIRRRNKKTFGSFSNRIQRLCIRRFFQRVLNTKEMVVW